ncbi:MAG: von Willebrand factor type A domain-containing protein [Bacteroidota bacterium]
MRARSLLLAALALAAVSASAQSTGTLAGRVLDGATNEGLPGANVLIEGTTLGAATDIDGNYRIIGVPVGSYTITASYAGYQSQSFDDVPIHSGYTRQLEFSLGSGELGEITVEYERPIIQRDAIGAPRVVGADDYSSGSSRRSRRPSRPRPAQGTSRAASADEPSPVRGVGAVTALQGSVVEGSGNLNVRGGRSEEIQYFVDGVRVRGLVGVHQQAIQERERLTGSIPARYENAEAYAEARAGAVSITHERTQARTPRPVDREAYAPLQEIPFRRPGDHPLSTFSIDVDRASYANARRFLMRENRLPVPDAVRVEEFVNAFDYELAGPARRSPHPFAIHTEVAQAPWAEDHQLVRVALQGRRIDMEDLQAANLVFLLDVSGSMSSEDKLPLLKKAFRLLVNELRPEDHVSIVVYAGASGLVLEPTPGDEKATILAALDRLRAGGSTAGAAGIELAYQTARRHFDEASTNRVILATDGDFNVGMSSDAEMKRLIERERESGVFLSVLGFGTGNLQDSKMETLANAGNGNYSYIDSLREAERVFVREFGGTLVAIAKDVKIQIEFNPAEVAGYRLIGYENRRLRDEEFNDDTRDAGELGAGHTVTALYEVIPVGVDMPTPGTDALKYQRVEPTRDAHRGELMTVKLRYKPATGPGTFSNTSDLLSTTVRKSDTTIEEVSDAMRWATAVTEAALVLQDTKLAPMASLEHALDLARSAKGPDVHGDRAEFIRMMEVARQLKALESDRAGSSL